MESDQNWKPAEAESDPDGSICIVYRNESGEEYVHTAYYWRGVDPRELCWPGCSGDWPGCRAECPMFNTRLENQWDQI